MDFDLTDVQAEWRRKGEDLGKEVAADAAAARVVMGAARLGLLDPRADVLAVAVAVEAMACESPAAAVVFALHSGGALGVAGGGRYSSLFRGETVAAVGLSSDDLPVEQRGSLFGRAPWVASITDHGAAVVGARSGDDYGAFAVPLDAPGVTIELVSTAGLAGVACGHVSFTGAACTPIGPTLPFMTRIRILMAAAGLGMGRRALREALAAARDAHTASAGEQTVQGLLADAATELDAAMLMTWKAAFGAGTAHQLAESTRASGLLADASLAKLAATSAAQRAVERATQVVGVDSFQRGHIVERLAQDVRALELFAGRTEALRAAAAEDLLPST
jgi:alkylation response protein AidB-like acyl-CoA dehydrogenase